MGVIERSITAEELDPAKLLEKTDAHIEATQMIYYQSGVLLPTGPNRLSEFRPIYPLVRVASFDKLTHNRGIDLRSLNPFAASQEVEDGFHASSVPQLRELVKFCSNYFT
jgi:hypothetical protein